MWPACQRTRARVKNLFKKLATILLTLLTAKDVLVVQSEVVSVVSAYGCEEADRVGPGTWKAPTQGPQLNV